MNWTEFQFVGFSGLIYQSLFVVVGKSDAAILDPYMDSATGKFCNKAGCGNK